MPDTITDGTVLPVDKPKGCTSFDVVRDVRRLVGHKKVGHAGTLDPLATGLLIILVARPATRLQDAFMFLRKTYTCTIRLGQTTASYDSETEVEESTNAGDLSDDVIRHGVQHFIGDLEQVPPMYSAVKMKGEKLYEKARRGETVERPPRPVTVYVADVTGIRRAPDAANVSVPEPDLVSNECAPNECVPSGSVDVHIRFECSKGTYIRSLARDIGSHLGVGGHLTVLRRTAIGAYTVEDAWTLDRLRSAYQERTSVRTDSESSA